MRFKAKFFEDENETVEEYDTYGFKTKRSPKPVDCRMENIVHKATFNSDFETRF